MRRYAIVGEMQDVASTKKKVGDRCGGPVRTRFVVTDFCDGRENCHRKISKTQARMLCLYEVK